MTPNEMRATIARLGWTQVEASIRLGVSAPERVNEWTTGIRRIPPYIAVSLRNLERLELATDLAPGNREPEPMPKSRNGSVGTLVVTLDTLREDGHKLRRHAYRKRYGTGSYALWHAVCECGWTSAKSTRKRDVDTMHVAHLRQIIVEWNTHLHQGR